MIDLAEKDTAPLASASGVGDFNCGPTVAGAVGSALYQREQTGKGTRLTYSLYANAIWDMTSWYVAVQAGKMSFPKSRKDSPPLNTTYRCRDGEWIIITGFDWDSFFPKVCEIVEHPELLSDNRFKDMETAFLNKRDLIDIFDDAFAKVDSDIAFAQLKKHGIPATKLTHFKDVLTDEQALANNYIYKFETRFPDELGTWYVPASPVQFGGPYPPEHRPGPLLGEHTDEVLTELGFNREAITKMREEKAIL